MKKTLLAVALLASTVGQSCAWSDPEGDYFSLFTQSIIRDKSYMPFLRVMESPFYTDDRIELPDENVMDWVRFFNNKINYQEAKYLVYDAPEALLVQYKNGGRNNGVLNKLGDFYSNAEAIDYLIEAKRLQPFMKIKYVENPENYYVYHDENAKDATQLDLQAVLSMLKAGYARVKNPDIKLRYGYQMVRFLHYNRDYAGAIAAFQQYVEPLKANKPMYFWALDQYAGAQRGTGNGQDANWNFFQVFEHSPSRRESAFTSMKLSDSAAFKNILQRASTPEEKSMAHFLLAYDSFSNPISQMKAIREENPKSELLKVLTSRAINELEGYYLPAYFYDDDLVPSAQAGTTVAAQPQTKTPTQDKSWWEKIVSFFKNLFSSDKTEKEGNTATVSTKANDRSDEDLLDDPHRLPVSTPPVYGENDSEAPKTFLKEVTSFVEDMSKNDNDAYWKISYAYLQFLNKDYEASQNTLNSIQNPSAEYRQEIQRISMLNDIVAQPRIDSQYEEKLMKTYPELFAVMKDQNVRQDSTKTRQTLDAADFVRDILANRYHLQGEDGKSFLMNNTLSSLTLVPDVALAQAVETFINKKDKTTLEKEIVAKNIDDVGDVASFFQVIYGDNEMRQNNFAKAAEHYRKVTGFAALKQYESIWNEEKQEYDQKLVEGGYNGFSQIPSLIFGHSVMECFNCPDGKTMRSEDFSFDFIKEKMNKLDIAEAALQLQNIAKGRDTKAAQANQLLGNLLYNTSVLGYYRHVFVLDINNINGGKFDIVPGDAPLGLPSPPYYYKSFGSLTFNHRDNFDHALGYYQKALQLAQNREQKARILFQIASAEQGKYYQYEAQQPFEVSYSDENYDQKREAFDKKLADAKNTQFRKYFQMLKKDYANTQTSKELMGSCSYYAHFMKK